MHLGILHKGNETRKFSAGIFTLVCNGCLYLCRYMPNFIVLLKVYWIMSTLLRETIALYKYTSKQSNWKKPTIYHSSYELLKQ